MITRILHTSDWHLDSTIYGKRIHASKIFETALQVVKLAAEHGCKAIVNSGDTLNSSKVGSYPIYQLDVIHAELLRLGIPMYTLTGNHDMDDPQWISRYVSSNGCGIVSIDNKTIQVEGPLHIHGFMSAGKKDFFTQLDQINIDQPTIGVWHGGIVEFTGGGNYPTVDEILAFGKVDTWLMGDIHVCRYIEKDGKIIGYPGPIGMLDVTENPEKFVTVMDIDTNTGKCVHHELVPLNSVPLIKLQLTNEQEYNEAEKVLISTKDSLRVIWFHFTEDMEAAMSALMVHTNPNDVIRHRNITPRLKDVDKVPENAIINSKETLREVGEELLVQLPSDLYKVGLDIICRTVPHQVAIEKLITQHENSFN